MMSLLFYLLLSLFSSVLLYGIYLLFFRNDRNFILVRGYLLFSVLFSSLFPFIRLPVGNIFRNEYSGKLITETLSEIEINALSTGQQSPVNWWEWIYWAGVVLFTLLLFVKIFKIASVIYKAKRVEGNVLLTEKNYSPFSFCCFVIMQQEDYEEEGREQIITHEKEHIKQGHTADLIFLEIVKIFQWFNPMIRLYSRSLKSVHEYSADASVLKAGADPYKYLSLIFKQSTGYTLQTIGHSFNQVLTKKRIKMMTMRKKSRMSAGKLLFALPVVALLLFVNCEKEGKQNTSTQSATDAKDDQSVQVPSYHDLAGYIGQNLVYPEMAKEKKVEGMVVIEFDINSNGDVENAKLFKSQLQSPEGNVEAEKKACIDAAIDMVEGMEKWDMSEIKTPEAKYTMKLPIRFALQ